MDLMSNIKSYSVSKASIVVFMTFISQKRLFQLLFVYSSTFPIIKVFMS